MENAWNYKPLIVGLWVCGGGEAFCCKRLCRLLLAATVHVDNEVRGKEVFNEDLRLLQG